MMRRREMDGSYRTNEYRASGVLRSREQRGGDPYAPPKMYHDKGGGFVRIAVMVLLLGAAGAGYAYYAQNKQPSALDRAQAQANAPPTQDFAATTPAPQQPLTKSGAPAAET